MTKPEEVVGQRFGRLVALDFERRKKSQVYFNCYCDCGNSKWIRKDHLIKKETLSCGCIKYKNIIGKEFGKLTALERLVIDGRGYYKCLCECGEETIARYDSLIYGATESCGCLIGNWDESRDGRSKTRLYRIYQGMKSRCYYEKSQNYESYGGRGIVICDEWLEDYNVFKNWAMNNGYSDELSIDRIDNDGNYEPDNCRWEDAKVQANNRRSSVRVEYRGELKTLEEVSKITGLSKETLNNRRKKGIDFDKPNRNGNKSTFADLRADINHDGNYRWFGRTDYRR